MGLAARLWRNLVITRIPPVDSDNTADMFSMPRPAASGIFIQAQIGLETKKCEDVTSEHVADLIDEYLAAKCHP